jgi:molybdate transport system substrate-binding protein
MMKCAIARRWFAFPLLCCMLLGCGRGFQPTSPAGGPGPSESVLVLVAASTKDAVQEIAAQFSAETDIAVKINADDSSKLATQITHDAPGDIFLSANEKWAMFVKNKGFAQEVMPLLGNALVIVVPKGNPSQVSKPADLIAPGVKRVALAGPTVPAGIYARQALKSLELWNELEKEKKVVAGENVRVTLTYVERGEVDAGIVYATDARISEKVEVVYTVAPATHDPIVYPLVLTKAGAKNPAARQFYDYLQSPPAAATFKNNGFARLAGK